MLKRIIYFLIWITALLSSPLAKAQVTAPTQGGEVSLIRVTPTSMELRFGITGNGQGRIVIMAATSYGISTPLVVTNGTFYSAANSYGKGSSISNGYVVYCGTGHSVIVTDLSPNTYYYITTAEFNQNDTTIAYNTYSSSVSASTRAAASTALATQISTSRNVEIYPNPSTGQAVQVALHGYDGTTCCLILTDAIGRQVANQKMIINEQTYSILTLPQELALGSYLLTILANGVSPVYKQLVINN